MIKKEIETPVKNITYVCKNITYTCPECGKPVTCTLNWKCKYCGGEVLKFLPLEEVISRRNK